MGGILGRLFKEFAVTICVAILISGVVSVTLTPMLCSRFLKEIHHEKHSWFYRVTERFFDGLLRVYDRSLQWVLRYRPVTMVLFMVVLAATGYLFIMIPKGFIPDQDTDQIAAVTEAAQGTSLLQDGRVPGPDREDRQPRTRTWMRWFPVSAGPRPRLWADPIIGQLVVHLKPRGDAQSDGGPRSSRTFVRKLEHFPGMKVYLQNPPTVRIGGQVTKSLYQFSLRGARQEGTVRRMPRNWRTEFASCRAWTMSPATWPTQSPQVNVTIDRDKAAAMQVNAQQIENALYDAYGPRWISTIYASINEYKVLLELKPEYQADPRALSHAVLQGQQQQADSAGHHGQRRRRTWVRSRSITTDSFRP